MWWRNKQLGFEFSERPDVAIAITDSDITSVPAGDVLAGDGPGPWLELDQAVEDWARTAPPHIVQSVRIQYEVTLLEGNGVWLWNTTLWIPPAGRVDSLGQLVTHVRAARIAAQVILSGATPDPVAASIELTATAFLRLLGRAP